MKKGLKKLPYAVLTTTMVSSIFGGTAFGALDGLYVPRDGQVEYYSSQFLTAAVVDQEKFDAIQDAILNTDANFDEIFFVWEDLGYSHSLQGLVNDEPAIDVDAQLPETVLDMLTEKEIDPTPGQGVELTDVAADTNDDNSVTITGVAEGAAEVEITLVDPEGNESSETVEVDEEGNFEFTSEADLAAGDWTYKVVAFDEEGNELDSEEGEFTIDDVAELPVVESVSAVAGTDMKVTVTGKAENADKVTVSVDGGAEAEATLSEDGSFTYTTNALAAGDHTVSVKAYKGEEASEAKTATVKVEAPALAVKSVTADTLKTFSIEFNKAVDSKTVVATAVANPTDTVRVYNSANSQQDVQVKLSGDGKTLYVTKTTGQFNQAESFKVVLDGIKTTSGEALAKYENTVTAKDITSPEVVSAVATTSKTIDIYFSEPVNLTAAQQVWNDFTIDGVAVFANLTTSAKDNKVTLTLSSSLTTGAHTLVVKPTVKDYAGFPITEKSFSLTVTGDTSAPEIASATLKAQNKIEVVFNEPVVSSTIATNSVNFTVTPAGGTTRQVTSVTNPSGDMKTFELTLAGDLEAGAIVDTTISYLGVTDLEGNAVTGTAKTFHFTAPNDSTAPTATVTGVSNGKISITFSEAVDSASLANAFELYDSNNVKVRTASQLVATAVTGDTTGTKYEITVPSYNQLSGNYTLKLLANLVEDESVRKNKAAEATFTVTFGDTASPSIVTANINGQLKNNVVDSNNYVDTLVITVPFDEVMDKTSAENLSNYIINNGGADIVLSTVAGATATLSADGKSVTLSIPADSQTSTTQVVVKGQTIANTAFGNTLVVKALALKDAAGNNLTSSQINQAYTVNAFNASGATITSAKLTDKRTVVITSDTPFASINPNAIRFVGATTTTDVAQEYLVAGVSFSADKKTATLTLNKDVPADAKVDIDETTTTTLEQLKIAATDTTAFVDSLGRYVATQTLAPNGATITVNNAAALVTVADYFAPSIFTVSKHATNDDTIVLEFTEALASTNATVLAGIANDLVITLGDGTILNPAAGEYTVADAIANDAKLEVQILKNGVVGQTATVALNNGRYIKDNSSQANVANAFTAKQVMNGTSNALLTEKVAPTATLAAPGTNNSGTKLVVTFSEPLYIGGAAVADGTDIKTSFTASDLSGGATAISITSAVYNAVAKTVTFTIAGAENTDTIAINASTVKDAAGNAATGTFIFDGTKWN